MGEAAFGRRYGNRAMVWGAIAGTIPDLDVVGNLFLEEMPALAFHRGITHSLLFAFLFPLLLGYVIHRLYDSDIYKRKWFKGFGMLTSVVFYALLSVAFYFILTMIQGRPSIETGVVLLALGGWIFFRMWKRYIVAEVALPSQSRYWDWVWLVFLATVTHPILDSCTAYGTQLWQPFSDTRVAWHNISVVDPLFTLPFFACVVVASTKNRLSKARFWWNWSGIIFSLLYMGWTVGNKIEVTRVFERTLEVQEIEYKRYLTTPTILNNILWYCVAEADSGYYSGTYSLMEQQDTLRNMNYLQKNHDWIEPYKGDRDLEIAKWFSDGYFNVIKRKDGRMQLNDLRYGAMTEDYSNEDDYVFAFIIEERDEWIEVKGSRGRNGRDGREAVRRLWQRMWYASPEVTRRGSTQ